MVYLYPTLNIAEEKIRKPKYIKEYQEQKIKKKGKGSGRQTQKEKTLLMDVSLRMGKSERQL